MGIVEALGGSEWFNLYAALHLVSLIFMAAGALVYIWKAITRDC